MDETSIIEMFTRLTSTDRLGHAYILQHPSAGVLTGMARTLAQSLLCEKREERGMPCGECSSCLQLLSGNHPGLIWTVPDGASVKIAQMRTAIAQDRHRASREGKHIIVIAEAQRMTLEAGNSILKWVEEPAEGRLFLLLTPSLSGILPTLRSRSVPIRVQLAKETQGVNEEVSALSALLGEDRFALAQTVMVELTKAIAEKRLGAWQLFSGRFAKLKLTGEEVYGFLDCLLLLLRDAALVKLGGQAKTNLMAPQELQEIVHSTSAEWLAEASLLLAEQRRRLLSHVTMQLSLEAMFINMLTNGREESIWLDPFR